eukprot:8237588-Pyramimonas_sp.AAC.1
MAERVRGRHMCEPKRPTHRTLARRGCGRAGRALRADTTGAWIPSRGTRRAGSPTQGRGSA